MMRLLIILALLCCMGCSYWPQTFEGDYYKDGLHDMKDDVDDVSGARTL